MNIWLILLKSIGIFLCLFVPYLIYVHRIRKRKILADIETKIKNWEYIRPPENEKYVIIKGKDIKIKDIIIYLGLRFEVVTVSLGKGACSEFGEYVCIVGKFINTNPTDPIPIKQTWIFENSPIIKCINE